MRELTLHLMLLFAIEVPYDGILHLSHAVPVLAEDDAPIAAAEIGVVWPPTVRAPHRVVDLVHEHRHVHASFGNGLACRRHALAVGLRLLDRVTLSVTAKGQRIARDGMRLPRVDSDEMHTVSVLGGQIVVGRTLSPEGCSGEWAQDQNYRLVRKQLRQRVLVAIGVSQRKVDCQFADLGSA